MKQDMMKAQKQRQTAIGCMLFLAICLIVAIGFAMMPRSSQLDQSVSAVCEWANSKGANCNPSEFLQAHETALQVCQVQLGTAFLQIDNVEAWHDCLLSQNVNVFNE